MSGLTLPEAGKLFTNLRDVASDAITLNKHFRLRFSPISTLDEHAMVRWPDGREESLKAYLQTQSRSLRRRFEAAMGWPDRSILRHIEFCVASVLPPVHSPIGNTQFTSVYSYVAALVGHNSTLATFLTDESLTDEDRFEELVSMAWIHHADDPVGDLPLEKFESLRQQVIQHEHSTRCRLTHEWQLAIAGAPDGPFALPKPYSESEYAQNTEKSLEEMPEHISAFIDQVNLDRITAKKEGRNARQAIELAREFVKEWRDGNGEPTAAQPDSLAAYLRNQRYSAHVEPKPKPNR